MGKWILAAMIAVGAVSAQAAGTGMQVDPMRSDMQRNTEWIDIQQVTKTNVKRVGTDQHAYFFFNRDGKENFVTVNASADPVVYSYLMTAYITGAPVRVKLTSPSGFVVVAELG